MRQIEFIDLAAQRKRFGESMEQAVLKVLAGGQYILGPEVTQFEAKLAAFAGAEHAIGTANGTDAIGLCLMAMDVGPGDAVICPAFTFAATAEVVAWRGATPIFVDIDEETYTLAPEALPQAMETASRENLTVRAVIAVDLFGQMADYDRIIPFCAQHGLKLICDSAQGFGASYKGKRAGAIGDFTTASFFPAKPLGCYGDGGAVLTNDQASDALLRSLRFHGKGDDKYDNVRIGLNSRLDTLQAAILLEKLAVFEEEIAARQQVAERYEAGLSDIVRTPVVRDDCVSVWAQYTLRVRAADRGAFQDALKAKGIPTNVYYPKPLNEQTAYKHYPVVGNGLPVSERVAREVVSLPMHPYLDTETQGFIIKSVREAIESIGSAKVA